MKNTVISNDFYVSEFLMKDLDSTKFQVLFEHELKVENISKTISRLNAFLPFKSGESKNVIIFAIENILVLDHVYRNIGKPKIWLWNPIFSMKAKNRKLFLSYVKRKNIEVWSFDQSDVKQYGFRYHDQIHSSLLLGNREKDNGTAFFSGVDKGRLETIKAIEKDLSSNFIESDFHVVRDKKKKYSPDDIAITTDQYMDFSEYLKKIATCKVIVDIEQSHQKGITLRVIEALFSNKKLITTNTLVKDMSFYNSSNIYLYGNDERKLIDFLNEPFTSIADDIKQKYTVQHLIDNMLY